MLGRWNIECKHRFNYYKLSSLYSQNSSKPGSWSWKWTAQTQKRMDWNQMRKIVGCMERYETDIKIILKKDFLVQ